MITLYAIYNNNPESFEVRRWTISTAPKRGSVGPLAMFPGRVDPTLEAEWGGVYPSTPATVFTPVLAIDKGFMSAQTLDAARSLVPAGLKKLERETFSTQDDPTLIEVWA